MRNTRESFYDLLYIITIYRCSVRLYSGNILSSSSLVQSIIIIMFSFHVIIYIFQSMLCLYCYLRMFYVDSTSQHTCTCCCQYNDGRNIDWEVWRSYWWEWWPDYRMVARHQHCTSLCDARQVLVRCSWGTLRLVTSSLCY